MPKYDKYAEQAWLAILEKVRELHKSGARKADISRMLGHKGRSAVSNWLDGKTTAQNSSFAEMLRYMDVLQIDTSLFLPWTDKSQNCEKITKKLELALLENEQLKEKLLKAEARADAFQELLEKQLGP